MVRRTIEAAIMRKWEVLRFRRILSRLKQYEIADKVGISESTLSKIENGRRKLLPAEAEALAKIYKCPVADLLDVEKLAI